jgi:hypothetical protein
VCVQVEQKCLTRLRDMVTHSETVKKMNMNEGLKWSQCGSFEVYCI